MERSWSVFQDEVVLVEMVAVKACSSDYFLGDGHRRTCTFYLCIFGESGLNGVSYFLVCISTID